MDNILISIFLLSCLALIIGMIKPKLVLVKSRKAALKFLLPFTFILFFAIGFVLEPVDETESSNQAFESLNQEKKEDERKPQLKEQNDIEPGAETEKPPAIQDNQNEQNDNHTEQKKEPKDKNNEEDNSSNEDKEADEKRSDSLSKLSVHYINAGQADATLFDYDVNGEDFHILLDSGDWNSDNITNYLHHIDVIEIDLLIGTHNHADHIGQMDRIIQQFEVEEVWLNGGTAASQTFERVITAIENNDINYHEPRTGEEYEIGTLDISVHHPSSLSGNSNDDSISTKLTYGDTSFFFSGDTEASGESKMVSRGGIEADILQLGHHGSSTSNTSAFLTAVDPDVAIYSAGSGNSYGHPHDEVINRIQEADVDLYGTDVHGTIIVSTNGKGYSITTNQNGNVPSVSKSNESSGDDDSRSNNKEEESTNSSSNEYDDRCININKASSADLQEIIHIGPERAESLISLRPFSNVASLDRINGIGPARVEDIKSQGLACTSN